MSAVKTTYGTPAFTPRKERRSHALTDVEVCEVAGEFREVMYGINRHLTAFEKFEFGSKIRRAAFSLANKIVPGLGRCHYLGPLKSCLNSRGSTEELIDDLNVCEDVLDATLAPPSTALASRL